MSNTLIGIFVDTVRRRGKDAQFMRRVEGTWENISGARALADVQSLAAGLAEHGVSRGDRVALLSENRYEWAVTDLAVLSLGAITVPIYPTLTAAQCRALLVDSGAKVAVVSTAAQLAKLRTTAADVATLRSIVVMDAVPIAGDREAAFATVMQRGATAHAASPATFAERVAAVLPDDLATIIYTSGTTGEPKGAMLTHHNIASNVEAALATVKVEPTDTCLSFLPLCHIFERMAGMYTMLAAGATIAYADSLDTVSRDVLEVRPTVINGVPRFYEKVCNRVLETVAAGPPLRRRLFHWGLEHGRRRARAHFAGRAVSSLSIRLADRLVGAKVRERMGGRLRLCVSGGAPLAPSVLEFFFAIGITVLEGYGLTETSPVITLNPLGGERPGSVGRAFPGVEMRIGDGGEVLTRGPHVMRGYWNNETATAEVIRDGWFHTGDAGRVDDHGYLYITDRIKDLLVLAAGKKVAPQPIEAKLKQSAWIAEVVLLGDRRPFVVGLIVPQFARLEAEASARGWPSSRQALLDHPGVRALFDAEVAKVNADLAPFETIKRFALLPGELTLEAGELTPTLKVKRRVLAERMAAVIEGLYVGHGSAAV